MFKCLWMGYADDHSAGTYRLYNPATRKIILSRDVTFLGEIKETEKVKEVTAIPKLALQSKEYDEDSDDEYADMPVLINRNYVSDSDNSDNELEDEEEEHFMNYNEDVMDEEDIISEEQNPPDFNPKVARAMRNLQSSFNPEATRVLAAQLANQPVQQEQPVQSTEAGRDNPSGAAVIQDDELSNLVIEQNQITEIESKPDELIEPTKFDQAWNHENPIQRKQWREAIGKEFNDMETRKVWRKVDRSDMPQDKRCVKCKWVFKIKRSGVFRARLVACGYSQIAGVDFMENYSPVVNDVTFRLLLLAMMYFGLTAKIVDVETAFLYGEIEEEIFMECPPGMKNVTEKNALALLKCIYGLVQAARQYYKKFVAILRKIGFKGGDVDPCLFTRHDKNGHVFIAIYVDDNLIIGKEASVDKVIKELKENGLVLKVETSLHDYLSCDVNFSQDRKQAWLGQPHLISNLERTFGEEVKGLRKYLTPGTPSLRQIRETDEAHTLSPSKQHRFRSGVGMLNYLVKHSRPDIANCTRELSKVLDGSTPASYKEMLRVIKYVLDTRTLGLKLCPKGKLNEPWNITCFTDSDYAGDGQTRRSVSGYIIYVHGVPVQFRSKSQQSVTLSSTEAEWMALSEAVKDILFLKYLCESMGIRIEKPITVRVDNMGAVFMSNNVTTSQRTKHIDIRSKFVREYVQDGVIIIVFFRSEENDSDIMTKNLGSVLHERHSKKLVRNK